MNDSSLMSAEAGKAVLEYPIQPAPGFGQSVAVAPGILWLRMPLPFSLDHINLWAIEEDEGWAIVDTGLSVPATVQIWNQFLRDALQGRPVTRVFVTHMHPDHIGLAGWLTRKFGCRLWITRSEYMSCRVLVGDTGREAPLDGTSFYHRAGWTEIEIENYRTRFGAFGKTIYRLPDSYRRIVDDELIRIGRHQWQVVVGSGHSPEHACLYCPELKLFISGDQVLPRISSNVSVHAIEPDADPLADWLHSLQKLRERIPDEVLVLPAHNEAFRGLHARIDRLAASQERALGRLREALTQPQRAIDVFGALFSRPINGSTLLGMATGESLANLNYLLARGEIAVETDEEGVARYSRLGV